MFVKFTDFIFMNLMNSGQMDRGILYPESEEP